MQFASAFLSDVGLKRDHNEDACCASDDVGLYVVCDGMGGHAAGEVASNLAVTRLKAFFVPKKAQLSSSDLHDPAVRQRLARLADAAIQDACQHVFTAATDGKTGKPGMGTTLTMLLLLQAPTGRVAVVGHVGDSRLYLRRSDTLYPLTRDHSFVNEMVERGALSHEDALKHPMANLLTRAVGPTSNVQADTNVLDVYDGDVFFLCSDGITKGIPEKTMSDALAKSPDEACKALVDAANAAGGDDNATAVVVRVSEPQEDPTEKALSEGKVRALAALALFRGLSHAELAAVVSVAGLKRVAAGQAVHASGVVVDTFFVLLDGAVTLRLQGADVLEVRPGEHFAEVEFFNERPAILEAIATKSSTVLTFDRAHMTDLFRRDPSLGVKLLWRFSMGLGNRIDEVLRRGTLTE